MKKPAFLPILGAATAALALALASGCNTTAPRDLMMDEAKTAAGERPVAMRGNTSFLEGKLAAEATISRGFGVGSRAGKGGRGRPGEDETDGRRRRDRDGIGEVYNVGYGESEEEQKEMMEDYMRMAKAQRARGSPMPPVTLRVILENRGTEPLQIEVTDVNSDLGNFAARPSSLTIAPGAKAELEPMISQLGVTSDEIPLQLAVRVGGPRGKKELQVVEVKNIILPQLRK